MSGACPELGFGLRLRIAADVDAARLEALRRAFVVELIEPRGLVVGGAGDAGDAGDERVLRHTITGDAGQATEADREAVAAWATARREVVGCQVGPLVDLSGAA